MRLIAAIMTLVALGAAALAGQKLRAIMTLPAAETAVAVTDAAPVDEPTGAAEPAPTYAWPPLFGELAPPAPPPEPPKPPEPEPQPPAQPPAPPKPPVESLGYALKGVIRAGDSVWAMVSHPTGEQIMRVGDTLVEGVTIQRIDEAGLWVDNGGDEPELLGFAQAQPQQP